MSGGQHRDDEVNGPSRSGERETERSRNRESNQPSKEAQRRRNMGVLRKGKIENETFLTGPASLEMFSTPI
jgi:hypothetical protein